MPASLSAKKGRTVTGAGARSEVRSEGYRRGPPEVIARSARGEPVDPAPYCFRASLRFATADPARAWLDGILAMARGERLARTVPLRVLEVC